MLKCVLLVLQCVVLMIKCALVWGQVPTDIEHTTKPTPLTKECVDRFQQTALHVAAMASANESTVNVFSVNEGMCSLVIIVMFSQCVPLIMECVLLIMECVLVMTQCV